MTRIRGYLGMSLDGRIAGPDDELGWLVASGTRQSSHPVPATADDYVAYDDFIADVGAMLMGRRTYDVVTGLGEWPYGDLPIIVATSRPLASSVPTVEAVAGSVPQLVEIARDRAGDSDVYADGGVLVSGLLAAGLLDELTTTILPTVRGPGIGLFDAVSSPVDLLLTRVATSDEGYVQLTWVPAAATT